MITPAGYYSTGEVARRTGLTYRQLDYWTRAGVITPSGAESQGPGTSRAWTREDLDRLAVLARVVRCLGEIKAELAEALWTWLGQHARWPKYVSVMRLDGEWVVLRGAVTAPDEAASIVVSAATGCRPVQRLDDVEPRRAVMDTRPL